MYTLARLYLDGTAIPNKMTKAQAYERARELMGRAADLGYPPAKEYLAEWVGT